MYRSELFAHPQSSQIISAFLSCACSSVSITSAPAPSPGTNPSLVEAMNLSLPILAFDCVYNRATTEEKCLYWKIAEDLQNLMKNKSGKFAEIAREMGEAGKHLYSWERIARQNNALYQ